MTTQDLAGDVRVGEILGACDRVLGEIGRRRHMFGWLRLPGAAADQWLAVDSYYPGNRIVVARTGEHDGLLSELVPAHGLRLVLVDAAQLTVEPAGLDSAVRRLVADLPPLARPRGPSPQAASGPRESAVARAFASATAAPERRRRAHARPMADSAPPERIVATGILIGVGLVGVLCAEIYVAMLALGDGHVLLAFGIALDGCARVLGTVAASRGGHRPWILPCVIGGSPAVALFALFQESGPVSTDPAPLGGLLSLVAIGVVGLALLGMLLGI
jgi:hypothetical protein